MRNRITEAVAVQCWFTAALLLVFGLVNATQPGTDSGSAAVQLLLGLAWIGIGLRVRQGGPSGRLVGLVASVVTVVFGVGLLISGQGYVAGAVMAIFVLVRLGTSQDGFSAVPQQYGQQPGQPQFGQPQFGQPQFGQPQFGQPQYPHQQYAQPPGAQAQYQQPQYPYGQPQQQQPSYGQYPQPPYGQPPHGQPPYGPPPGQAPHGNPAQEQWRRPSDDGQQHG